jgi:exodeoxyribonuclease V alpha subunit
MSRKSRFGTLLEGGMNMENFKLDASQLQAVNFCNHNNFAIVSGGAGTGKSTIIKEINDALCTSGYSTSLCAFAGKAAARLREVTTYEASTIHRLLKYDGKSFFTGSLDGIAVIIDEASMISSDLLAEIVKRRPDKLILVGDQAQLPPVGCGQPFHDIIELLPSKVKNLTTCYRNKEAIFRNAMLIRNGEFPSLFEESETEKFQTLTTGGAAKTQEVIIKWITGGMIDFSQDIILCPRNGGEKDNEGSYAPSTVKGLNVAIKAVVNPGEDKFSPNDRVINTKNFPLKDVWNGTTGTIQSIDEKGNIYVKVDAPVSEITYDDPSTTTRQTNMVMFDREEMTKHLELAYALTVHKSQGSQYRKVILIALQRDAYSLLDRSLIYTGVTRAREECVIVGEESAIFEGIKKMRKKNTVIQELSRG